MSEQNDAVAAPPTNKQRSPNHPAHSLEKALAKARLLLDQARMSPVPKPIACQYMKVKETSSSGMRWLSTLQEFGLVDTEGRGKDKTLRISERARILLKHPDKESDDYRRELREAALAPRMHQRLWGLRTDGHLPPDDALLWTLSSPEWGFTEPAAEAFVAQFRQTIAFAGLTDDPTEEQTGQEPEPPEDPSRATPEEPPSGGPQGGAGKAGPWKPPMTDPGGTAKDIPLPLQSGGTAVLHLPYPLDERDYKWITGLLQGLKESILAKQAPQEPSTREPEEEPQ